ncbi:alpha-2-macroglobulin [Elizabethkingia sp. JS20170427COW]|uniref:alpha-2-macroglobulin family protein n=1 Tax=Elizabethkingia sp. JS20170427COW TaxID=2583851 RepID=UPI001110AA07|nr:MG2 domain-containing protein [Elizabethkingia sp. JS20170427COW]QCX54237.1 hypothetical protein FGE20_11035 [Elizabethkingia sp. JS20170427COW]
MNLFHKTLGSFVIFFLSAQLQAQEFYKNQWKKIQANQDKGIVKSNLPLVLEIQERAIKEQNFSELIASLKEEFSITYLTQEDEKNTIVNQFFNKLKKVHHTLPKSQQAIFQALIIDYVQEYYQRSLWKITNITQLKSDDIAEIETWSKLDFKDYFQQEYQKLNNESPEKIILAPYQNLFQDADDIAYFPTLREWLTLSEISFLQNASLFTENELAENRKKIESLYQNVIDHNTGNTQLYFQFEKVNSFSKYSSLDEKTKRLEALVNSPTDGDFKVYILNHLAALHQGEASLKWLTKAEKIYPKSKFQSNIKGTKNNILRKELSINQEQFTLPNQTIQLSATYKNITQFQVKLYRVSNIPSLIESFRKGLDNNFSKVEKHKVREELFPLDTHQNYKIKTTSVEMQPLEAGVYLAQYLIDGKENSWQWFSVTQSRVISQKSDDTTADAAYKLVDRNTGKTLNKSVLEVYDYSDYNKTPEAQTIETDASGNFKFPSPNHRNYQKFLVVDASGGAFLLNKNNYYREAQPRMEEKIQTTILTDRGIYRPGQRVYFKAINIEGNFQNQKVAKGLQQKIVLKDANGQEVATQSFTTNDFGSYWGSFILPKNLLNGNFSLSTPYGFKNIKVEEYKRPNFEITFNPLKGDYKFGDYIVLKGKVQSFSGVPLIHTEVNFKIDQEDLRYRYFSWLPNTGNKNPILGEATTDSKGEFEFRFKLEKDENIKGLQVSQYRIQAQVTDINGESQENTTSLQVASVSHFLEVENIKTTFANEEAHIKVVPKNYNQQKLDKSYYAELNKLQIPSRVYRTTFANHIQNTPVYSQNDFHQKFPHDYYNTDELKQNWKVEKNIFKKSNLSEDLNLGKLEAGAYELMVYNIENQDTIKSVQRFDVWDKKSLGPQKTFLTIKTPKEKWKPGEKAQAYIYSAILNAEVYLYQQFGNGKVKIENRKINKGLLVYEFDIPKDPEISSINLQVVLPAYNDIDFQTANFSIEKENLPMEIKLTSFRDKIEPGQKEKWVVNISNTHGAKTAELLASMYDKSLDQFYGNSFALPSMKRNLFSQISYLPNKEYLISTHLAEEWKNQNYYSIQIPEYNWYTPVFYDRKFKGRLLSAPAPSGISNAEVMLGKVPSEGFKIKGLSSLAKDLEKIPVRENLNETAFFYPNLYTDEKGNVKFEFTAPQALTQWKMMFLAHDKNGNSAELEQLVITQKQLSVTPNYPRFLRSGDVLSFQSKINNFSTSPQKGRVALQLLNANTMEDITHLCEVKDVEKNFELQPNESQSVNWEIHTPKKLSSVVMKVVAMSGSLSDGEQIVIPIFENRTLVTETLPIFVKAGQTKTFTFDKLKNNSSQTIENFATTLELSTNPAWEVLMALPSIKKTDIPSADNYFNRWFADVLAAEIFKKQPRLKKVLEEYQDQDLLQSKLEINSELKEVLLQETPWVFDAQSEKEQMSQISKIFNLNQMSYSIASDWKKLSALQNGDGGFGWIQGSPSSLNISLYILKNLGKIESWLKGDLSDYQDTHKKELLAKLIAYVDRNIIQLKKTKNFSLHNQMIDYLDGRHYWEKEYALPKEIQGLKAQFLQQMTRTSFSEYSFYGLSRIAMLMKDYGKNDIAIKLANYLKETSTQTKNQGAYWKKNIDTWGWYSSRIANHASAVQALEQILPNDPIVEEAKIYLASQKRVGNWGNSRATAEVIYTFLNSGSSWTEASSDQVKIDWGGKELVAPPGTGWVKSSVPSTDINPRLAEVSITKSGTGIVQGGLFWQYYEDLDQVKPSENGLSISKEVYKKVKTENGEVLQKITSGIKVGDRLTVRLVLNSDRAMEYVHLKDFRPSGWEAVDVLSGYRWKDTIGFYQVAKDASTHFFIEQMPKGKYIFEYDCIANASGDFSLGFAQLQNYYAPEMNAISKGGRIKIN